MAITSAARQAADALGEEILGYEGDEEEWPLGSEEQLMEALGIGRPTLRQAARLLEQQQLLVVRRGVRGGLFGRRPTDEGVTANARVFLRAQHTTFAHLLAAELILGPACAGLAAKNPDEAARRGLLAFYDNGWAAGGEVPVRRFMELSTAFQREIGRLSESPVLHLYVGVLMDLASHAGGISDVYEDEERRRATVIRHIGVAEAIAAGRESLAVRRMTAHLQGIIAWSEERALRSTLEPSRHT